VAVGFIFDVIFPFASYFRFFFFFQVSAEGSLLDRRSSVRSLSILLLGKIGLAEKVGWELSIGDNMGLWEGGEFWKLGSEEREDG